MVADAPGDAAVEREIREWAAHACFVGVPVVIALGSARGWVPRILRERSPVPLVIYDPRAPCDAAVAEWPSVVVVTSPPALRFALREHVRSEGEPLLVHCDAADGELTHLRDIVERGWQEAAAGSEMERRSAVASVVYRSDVFMESLRHRAHLVPINRAADALTGMPAIVCGAGSSLDRQLDAIRAVQDRALIIGVNTSAPALAAAGIRCDVLVTCEAKAVAHTLPEALLREAVLVPGLHVHESLWTLPALRIAPTVTAEGGFGEWWCKVTRVVPIPVGGSCGTLAMGIAAALGCDPIIVTGHDGGADPETGSLYCAEAAWRGTSIEHIEGGALLLPSEAKQACDRSVAGDLVRDVVWYPVTERKAWAGEGTYRTVGPYEGLLQWMEEQTLSRDFEGRTLINASVGGARIHGWTSTRIEDLTLPECDPRGALLASLASAESMIASTLTDALRSERATAAAVRAKAARCAALLREARTLQCEVAESPHGGGDLLDTYSWPQLERDRLDGETQPVLERLADIMDHLVEGADHAGEMCAAVLSALDEPLDSRFPYMAECQP